MPLKHVGDGKLPPWKLPLVAPRKPAKKGDGKKGNSGSSTKGKGKGREKKDRKVGGDRDGDGDGDEDGGSTRMGIWEELFDAVNGTKIW